MKRTRSSHVRVKVVALLGALAALWSFAAYVTVRDGLNMLSVNSIGPIGFATSALEEGLQVERRLSAASLSGDSRSVQDELAASRARVDELVADWQEAAVSRSVRVAASGRLLERVDDASIELAGLDELRSSVDSGDLDPETAVAGFTAMIGAGFDVYASMASLDDEDIARQLRALIELAQARELMSQGDALLAGVLAEGRVTAADIAGFTKLVGAQRFQYESAITGLHPEDLALYEQVVAGSEVTVLRGLEDRFIQDARPGAVAPFRADLWQEAVEAAVVVLRRLELDATDNVVERATPVAIGVIVRLVLAGGLGLVALIAAITISVTTARALVRQLERLRDAARELANDRLPGVVARLSSGEKVNVAAEAPPLRFGDDEIGQVGQAFNRVQETAVGAAVQQAELRHGVRDVFLSLARRTQNLVHKQLGVLDGMERRETDADEMAELYRVDHLATRMRRNAENLIVLAGANPGRTWRRPVALIDVIRGAVGEVEDFTRVSLQPVDDAAMAGRAVGDTIHLLAELIENAGSFSPPYTKVTVAGQRVAHGFVVEIEDRGLGMGEEDLVAANAKLAHPPDFSLADATRLGLYVVAKLAQRHDLKVHLRGSPYGGVVAIVLIPNQLLIPTSDAPAQSLAVEGAGGPAASGREALDTRSAGPDHPLVGLPVPGPGLPAAGSRVEPAGASLYDPAADETTPVAAAEPAAPAAPAAPAEPELPADDGLPGRTPSGLPWRVRQASLPRQLPNGHGSQPTDDPPVVSGSAEVPAPRDPEQVRRMMRSYQHGTRLGRSEAGPGPDGPGHDHHQEG